MLSYHNDPKLKERVVQIAREHQAADRYIRGAYWDDDRQKGCAVGCTLHSLGHSDPGDHAAYEELLGLPIEIARLQDRIFEIAGVNYSKTWPLRFFEAVPVGKDLSMVVPKLMHWMMAELPGWEKLDAEKHAGVLAAIARVRKLYGRWLSGDKPSKQQWNAAADVADAADYDVAASYAARAVAYAARAAARAASYAAYAAADAPRAAYYAVYTVAYYAAYVAADAATVERIGDGLLELMEQEEVTLDS